MNHKVVLFSFLLLLPLFMSASPELAQYQINDSIDNALNDSINSFIDFQSDYLVKTEVEHQKLMRNIFAIGFVFMLGLLVFTIIFYGNKIKKVSGIIIMQNEVLNSTKDQLIKIINIFNYIDQQVYITDTKGNIEWHNTYASNWFTQDYEKEKVSLLNKFSTENQGIIFQGINEIKTILFEDSLYTPNGKWKMIPIKNSKDEFSNMVFVAG
ncbi:MAG: hypothetical protein P1P88_20980 [Bacteroidales bacterium]|nr:hypothetical protein [Bacteroidales bacterium]